MAARYATLGRCYVICFHAASARLSEFKVDDGRLGRAALTTAINEPMDSITTSLILATGHGNGCSTLFPKFVLHLRLLLRTSSSRFDKVSGSLVRLLKFRGLAGPVPIAAQSLDGSIEFRDLACGILRHR